MLDYFNRLYESTDFMPHGACFVWDTTLLWQFVGSDIATGIAYYLIAAFLLYFIFKRRDIPYLWVFLLFGAFFLSCGTTHFMAAWTIYYPSYKTQGIISTINAAISLGSAFIFIPLMPKLLALPNLENALEQVAQLNKDLKQKVIILEEEVQKREKAEEELLMAKFSIDRTAMQIFWIKEDASFLYVNDHAYKSLGYSYEELLLKRAFDIDNYFPQHQWNGHWEHLKKYGSLTFETQYRTKDGGTLPVEVTLNYLEYNGVGYNFAYATDITNRLKIEEEKTNLNLELENRVEARTAQLQDANHALEKSLADLKQAQEHLVQSGKMAALGTLVAGVAHEINTPVGIGVTAASHLEQKTRELEVLFAAGKMNRADFEKYLNTALESTASTLTNLNRAADLIKSFKQVAVDQASEERRRFRLKEYIDNLLLSLRPRYKRTRHTITVNCPDALEIYSYPGAFSQIITNLLINSLIHGFEHIEEGRMVLDASVEGNQLLLQYHDNGCGMDGEQVKKIFDPFFTSKRVHDSAGLGMHIVFNLVTGLLNGRIACHSVPGQGAKFIIEIPIQEENVDG
jgi:PAS domain S-box-containing protein